MRLLIALALAVGLYAPSALAQSITQDTLSGSESWSVGQGPGGPSSYITSDILRNSRAVLATTISASATIGSGALSALSEGGDLLLTAQPLAATLTLPPNPFTNGGVISVCNVTGSAFATNVVTLAANSGQTLSTAVTLTTLAANTCARVQFNRANTTWYRTM